MKKSFMVEFDVPDPMTEKFVSLIPSQRRMVDKYLQDGFLLSYCLSADRSKAWAVCLAESESELLEKIKTLPLTAMMTFDYVELAFHNTVQILPSMSLN